MPDPVLLDIENRIATITLNRPDAMNSLDIATKEALLSAVTQVAEDDTVRCLVLTGTGRAFCVGQDLKEHIKLLDSGDTDALFYTVDRHYNPIVTAIATMNKPVVAAVQVVAAGAGASLAFACDFRILSNTAGFNLAFTGIALSCDTGASWTLPRLVGRAKALELLYFPSTLSADESKELGLATTVVAPEELDDEVARLATRLANGPTQSFGSIRRSLTHAAGASLEEAVAFESEMMTHTGATEDHRAAVASFVAKQKPQFEGR
ncbi:MAG TPA: enoyl-CoA hydratase-related protein [Nocardioides sp.]